MKKMLLLFLCLYSTAAVAKFRFGDKHASIKIVNGGGLHVNNDVDINGTVVKETGGVIEGSGSLSFSDGVLLENGAQVSVTGSYNPTSGQLTLTGGQRLIADDGAIITSVVVTGSGNAILGQPLFLNPITFTNSFSQLTLGLQSALTQNIVLNGGLLSLSQDLYFTDNKFVQGAGTLNTNTRTLYTGNKAITANTNLTIANNSAIVMNAPLTLTGTWTCQGAVSINGNGFALDLSSGQIVVASGATLMITDAQLKNWGANSIILTDNTSKLQLSAIETRLVSDVTYTAGTVEVLTNSMFVLKASVLQFTGTSMLKIDGAIFSYNTNSYEFSTLNAGNMTILNGGLLVNVAVTGSESSEDEPLVITESTILDKNYMLNTAFTITCRPPEPVDMTVSFSDTTLTFSPTQSDQFIVDEGADVTLTHATIERFNPRAIAIAETASLVFGDATTIMLRSDQTLDFPLTFSGNAIVQGNGYTLTLSALNTLEVMAGGTLKLQNIVLEGVTGEALKGLANSSHFILENVTIRLAGTTTFSVGSYTVTKNCDISGIDRRFEHRSAGAVTIASQARLTLQEGVTFAYLPSDGATNLFAFVDSTAQFALPNSTFEVASTGVVLKKGTLVVDAVATINSLATDLSGAVSLGDGSSAANNVSVKIGPQGLLRINDGFFDVNDGL